MTQFEPPCHVPDSSIAASPHRGRSLSSRNESATITGYSAGTIDTAEPGTPNATVLFISRAAVDGEPQTTPLRPLANGRSWKEQLADILYKDGNAQ
jgi:hypothetical protein